MCERTTKSTDGEFCLLGYIRPCVVRRKSTDVSQEHVASILKAEE
jgi:hypothetical protein